MDPTAIHEGLGFGLVQPGVLLVRHRVRQGRGHVNKNAVVQRTRLQQKYGGCTVLAEPIGQHATRRAGADNDVVEGCHQRESAVQR